MAKVIEAASFFLQYAHYAFLKTFGQVACYKTIFDNLYYSTLELPANLLLLQIIITLTGIIYITARRSAK